MIFLHFPLLIIAIYAFNTEDAAFSFPPQGLTLRWFSEAAGRSDILQAVTLSLKIAALSTAIALVLGTLAAGALWRSAFFGKNAVSLLLLLPIALPGIITGLALLTAFKAVGLELACWRSWWGTRPSAWWWCLTTSSPASAGLRGVWWKPRWI